MATISCLPLRYQFATSLLALQLVAALGAVAAAEVPQGFELPRFAQVPEAIPVPDEAETEAPLPEECKPAPTHLPLSALNVDIQPRNRNHEVVANDDLPENCAQYVFTKQGYLSVDLTWSTCRPAMCDVLQLAHFCRRPLYFEEPCLERCGVRTCCCQPLGSAAHFYGTALLMPVKMMRKCPCSCVPDQSCY